MPSTVGMPARRRPPPVEFGRRVRACRLEVGLSQEALGHTVGLHPTYISSIERGFRNVSLVNIVKIATGLGVDPGELVRGMRP